MVFEGEELTYGELNARSNQLGHYLRDLGVKAETLVPICVDRSLEMIVGILGILKAGGAYVPVDPEYPLDRIGYMLEDTGAELVLRSRATREVTGGCEQDGGRVELGHGGRSADTGWRMCGVGPDRTTWFYVIYTSGSTGQAPKGVMIEQEVW